MNPYASNSPSDPATWLTPSLVISTLALIFTIASFWWIQVRRGRLRSYPPRSYAGSFLNGLRLSLPLVLYNSGPAPLVVLDFRLRIDRTRKQRAQARTRTEVNTVGAQSEQPTEEPRLPFYMSWHAIQPKLKPAKVDEGRVMPSPFPVEGRRAVERFIEFARGLPYPLPLDGPYRATVEVQLAHRRQWRRLVSFPLHAELVDRDTRARYIPRTNDPDWKP